MRDNKPQIALIMSSAFYFFFAFASCCALADPSGCAAHAAGGDKEFRKTSVNSGVEI